MARSIARSIACSMVCATVFLAYTTPAPAQTFTLDHFAKVARVTELRVAPAGAKAAIVVAWPNYERNAWESELLQVNLATGAQEYLTGRRTVAAPRWSPSGDRLAFTAVVEGKAQLFVLPMGGGEARQVTQSTTGVGIYAWKPDGSAFVYTAAEAPEKRGTFDDSFVVDGNDYLTLSAPQRVHLWTVSATGGEVKVLARGDWSVPGFSATVSWSADGRAVVFTKQDGPGTREFEGRGLAIADVATGTVTALPGVATRHCSGAVPSPDGASLVVACPVNGHVKNQTELAVLAARGGEPRLLTGAIDRNFARSAWLPDSKSIVAFAPDGTTSGLWEISLAGAPRRLNVGTLGITDVDVAASGDIVFIGSEPRRPPELYIITRGASAPRRLTNLHDEVAALDLGNVESMSWKSDDGLPLSGTLTLPPRFDASRKYPLLLLIHGGPWSSSLQTFSAQQQMLAAKGFLVFAPNYRGSDNHGNATFSAVYRDHGAGPGRDVMAGLAILKQRAYVDTARIGVSGWSYGGYMTTWLIGHYQGWKAAMAGAAVIDLLDDYHLNDMSLFRRAYGESLTSPQDVALMQEQSPGTYADAMTTPLLLLSNTGDAHVAGV
ncbi:MAG TPA: S9 family peptidase, partial [Gemmatimonas sp.]|nr:S9 family peptidase [Gemmatimonas sp.]